MSERAGAAGQGQGKAPLFLALLAGVLVLDVATKAWVENTMHLYQQIEVIGEYLQLHYIRNPGAAFGIKLGAWSRPVFMALSAIALVVLFAIYRSTPARDRVRIGALALVCGGALGNLIDRVRSAYGVVDFFDVGIGAARWPVFNVADMAVTTGAIVLALSLWKEERHIERGG